SGGKDSLTLLHVLLYRQKFIPVKIKLMAVHVDSGIPGFPINKLIKHFQKLGVDYMIEKIDFLNGKKMEDIDCFWCSWNRRKALFGLAEKLGFNKIAFGHHMDDIVETILLNLFFRGEIGAMRPKQVLFNGKLAVIRPLAYEREDVIARFAKAQKLENLCRYCCPHSSTSQRSTMKKILKALEKENPSVMVNVFRSLQNIRKDYLLDSAKMENLSKKRLPR
ncbi:MAG: tRNA 2-thiocytidine(32) synthetase TtcA, partial [Candidatus Omnitrophica bacterium]|nr:tRNA 2-thiocytidine(32) synthetase TtcA [Candidatus Omnitrophota bacterium]